MGISLHRGSVRQTEVGSSTWVFEVWLKGALEVECLSLLETWREGSLARGTLPQPATPLQGLG